ncbi:selenocysteine lyase-like [Actinia tenebrosa]|uniref:Selenocysteine lyase n=1 Tax=Actinia tenebrosa TaxID=6105 RepID=A0A6P8HY55_ACTTE|nr:selenocysteine lyase-like [Actinia tenebrosa]
MNEEKQPQVYLDYNATTPLDSTVLQSIHDALRDAWGNPSSSHPLGRRANDVIKQSRQSIADMVGAQNSEIIITSGGTEANNMVFLTAIRYYQEFLEMSENHALKGSKPQFIISNQEHDSVCLPVAHFAQVQAAEECIVNVEKDSGMVTAQAIKDAVKPNTCLVSVMLANNETGIIQPISEITQVIKSLNKERKLAGFPRILLHTDAAQAIGKIRVDVNDLGVDYLTIVGHKFYAPRIGALYVSCLGENSGPPLFPMLFGGGQERNYRPGTENTGMIAGLGQAAQLVVEHLDEYQIHMKKVRDYLETRLEEVFGSDNIHINGKFPTSERLPNTCNVSFIGKDLQGRAVLSRVKYLLASVGAACHSDRGSKPSPILEALGIPCHVAINAIRMSVGRETTTGDIDIVVQDLKDTIDRMKQEAGNAS